MLKKVLLLFFPTSCVAVIYNSRKNKQYHLFNSSKKPLSCLAYSGDGRFLATGEVGIDDFYDL